MYCTFIQLRRCFGLFGKTGQDTLLEILVEVDAHDLLEPQLEELNADGSTTGFVAESTDGGFSALEGEWFRRPTPQALCRESHRKKAHVSLTLRRGRPLVQLQRGGIELKLRPWWEQKTGLGSIPADPILSFLHIQRVFGARANPFIQMESRFSRHLSTNYIPSDEEIDFIRIELVSHTQELARIDERIHELFAQRDQIQAHIDSHKALISHPRRNAVISSREAPVLLGQICSAWRTIALSTPRLWASLHAPLDYILEKESRKLAVIEWLQRSGAAPISLSVFAEPNWGHSFAWSERLSLFKSLAESSARWCHLDLLNFLDKPGWEDQLAEISTPALESLELSGSVSLLRNLDIAKVPSLRAIALHSNDWDEHIDEFILEMPLVWSRLTHLTLVCSQYGQHSGISLRNVIVLLGRCPHLISFQGSLGAQSLGYLIDHVSMPQLRQFSVEELTGPTSLSVIALGTGSPLLQELGNLDCHLCKTTP
ncbi:hypothetical protein B0H14DRAFT_3145870 [Mycena olivaceomarginata]|nr:hypothetical protein B0H14DRAFT_3145870 [Mycena olivaceomarginata]